MINIFRKYFLLLLGLYFVSGSVLAQDWIYTTRPGDNLWGISKTYLKSVTYWKKLKEYNSVNLPKRLSPGVRLRIPIAWLKNQPEGVKVVYTRGEITVVRSDGSEVKVKNGDVLQVGDKIISDDNATATLRFADGSLLLLESESELLLDSLSAYESTGMVDTQLRLQRGGLETQVVPLRKSDSRYEIITPAAVAAVRGTRYRVGVDSVKKIMRTEVLDGKVNVANKKANQDVKLGYGTLAEQGKPPLVPRKLLEATDLTAVATTIRKLPFDMTWPSLAGALAYRVQIVDTGNAEAVIFDMKVSSPAITIGEVADGQYQIKVRGIDEIGLEGRNGRATINIDTSLAPALAVPEAATLIIEDRKITFKWQSIDDASGYQIQLATDVDFKNIITDEKINENEYITTVSQDQNEYFFRVRGLSELHEQGSFGAPHPVAIEEHGILYYMGTVLIFLVL